MVKKPARLPTLSEISKFIIKDFSLSKQSLLKYCLKIKAPLFRYAIKF